MTNAELIETLRCCAASDCEHCPKNMEPICPSMTELFNVAADALEAAEKRIAELEAQLPKEGEWIEANTRPRSAQFYCSVCHRTCYDIQPTRDKAWTKRCRYNYCPNCGAKMQTVTDCHTLEEGER